MDKKNLQDVFLNRARIERVPVTLFLMNGFQLRGVLRAFDGFSVRAVTEYAGKSENGERAVVFVSDELPPGAIELRRSAARIVAGD